MRCTEPLRLSRWLLPADPRAASAPASAVGELGFVLALLYIGSFALNSHFGGYWNKPERDGHDRWSFGLLCTPLFFGSRASASGRYTVPIGSGLSIRRSSGLTGSLSIPLATSATPSFSSGPRLQLRQTGIHNSAPKLKRRLHTNTNDRNA